MELDDIIMTGPSNEEVKCEFYKEVEDNSQLFFTEKVFKCTLENCECIYEGDGEVCPFKLGVFY